MTFCVGIPGGNGAHKVSDTEILVAGICEACESLLTSTRSWGSAAPVAGKGSGGKGPGIVINHLKHFSKPRLKGDPLTQGSVKRKEKQAVNG
jgi:hypothetical protein